MSASSYPCIEGPRSEILLGDRRYPPMLLDLPSPPPRLYVLGDPAALVSPCVSVVGARKATPYGIACAELAGASAAAMGLCVVSGAAIGCDVASQRAALDHGGRVCAVLGSGADVAYPARAADVLRRAVAGGGAVVSLQRWGSPPAKWAFVKRNAVIAALSRALVICEAGMPSGTFSTAEAASTAGREVLVFPGSIFSSNSTGSNYLIATDPASMPLWDRDCLELAYSRIYGVLRPTPRGEGAACGEAQAQGGSAAGETEGFTPLQAEVVRALQASPMAPGELGDALGCDFVACLRVLGGLEVGGVVGRLADGRYCLTAKEYLRHNGSVASGPRPRAAHA